MESQLMITMAIFALILVVFSGIKIIRPTHRGLIERLGKYYKFANSGFQDRHSIG